MKKYITGIVFIILTLTIKHLNAQSVNWAGLNERKHIINGAFALENGMIRSIGYSQIFNTGLLPICANIELSMPFGNKSFDDYKTKLGAQVRWFEYRNFHVISKIQSTFRRYENDFVRLVNFGSDMSAIVGYYRPKWFLAGEFGFDKAIITQFRHSDIYRNQFPLVSDGWFEPSTGGNFYFGIQTGYSFKNQDLTLKAGKCYEQDFKTKPTFPYYAQLGINFKF